MPRPSSSSLSPVTPLARIRPINSAIIRGSAKLPKQAEWTSRVWNFLVGDYFPSGVYVKVHDRKVQDLEGLWASTDFSPYPRFHGLLYSRMSLK